MGISKKLKEKYPNLITTAVEPSNTPLLTQNKIIGPHQIEGIGDDFIPDLVDIKLIDKVYNISDEEALNMTKLINQKLGLGVGISSGANLLGAILLNEEKNINNTVTIFPDDNKKYLTTNLTKEINKTKNLISNKIELIDYELI